jgi:hypothetical protein
VVQRLRVLGRLSRHLCSRGVVGFLLSHSLVSRCFIAVLGSLSIGSVAPGPDWDRVHHLLLPSREIGLRNVGPLRKALSKLS